MVFRRSTKLALTSTKLALMEYDTCQWCKTCFMLDALYDGRMRNATVRGYRLGVVWVGLPPCWSLPSPSPYVAAGAAAQLLSADQSPLWRACPLLSPHLTSPHLSPLYSCLSSASHPSSGAFLAAVAGTAAVASTAAVAAVAPPLLSPAHLLDGDG